MDINGYLNKNVLIKFKDNKTVIGTLTYLNNSYFLITDDDRILLIIPNIISSISII